MGTDLTLAVSSPPQPRSTSSGKSSLRAWRTNSVGSLPVVFRESSKTRDKVRRTPENRQIIGTDFFYIYLLKRPGFGSKGELNGIFPDFGIFGAGQCHLCALEFETFKGFGEFDPAGPWPSFDPFWHSRLTIPLCNRSHRRQK